MHYKKLLITLLTATLLGSCTLDKDLINDQEEVVTEDQVTQDANPGNDIRQLEVPANFDFSTTGKVATNITVNSIDNMPLSGVKVGFYTEHPDFGGKLISSAITNSAGKVTSDIQVPTYLQQVFVQVHATGMVSQQYAAADQPINLNFGGAPDSGFGKMAKSASSPIPISGNYYYMGEFTTGSNAGLPLYLEAERDDLSQEFLDDVNASLPEGSPVPDYNPQYLTTGNELDVQLESTSDVWVTFVHEGAGFRNALGYYVFDTDNPPANTSEIDSIYVVLPNTSFRTSGGELYSGDKVKLGAFEGGKTISWVLFQNAWNGSGVNVNATKYYSRIDFNTTESNPEMRQHTVQLLDVGRQILLNGFEDLPRSTGQSDEDFNDLIFYVSANPWESLVIDEVPPVTPSEDTDEDGVSDESDEFPLDPERAVRNTFTGTLAYEDLWPAQGDYDFNDLVMDYEIDHILNGNNLLVEIEADWTIKAVGAGFHNGFGIEFDGLSSSDIASVSGADLQEGLISNNANGTESATTTATIIFVDNIYNVIQSSEGAYVNTIPGNPYTEPVTLSTMVQFNTPKIQSNVGLPPYDAFIFANGDRSKEIHLPGQDGTSLADPDFYGTYSDATNPSTGYMYKTENGLPWAINLSDTFDHPIEGAQITDAYLNFAAWAISGGGAHKDWYLDLPANRNPSKIY
ncbi:LruC domain-containing protein [Gilvibacter sp.]|uniref:LruC domain-containing protein n=1 Tax=Gilvibacter sp. TaxID=2729997 RepID=UPI0025BCBC21|nr:LruC domain-containing protein [Gilvibacter sp.]NQX77376.1 LruC domain-containing protein [Gilvibacter sp.]